VQAHPNPAEAAANVSSLFNALDKDGDGVITQSEFVSALGTVGGGLSPQAGLSPQPAYSPQPPSGRRPSSAASRPGMPARHLIAPPTVEGTPGGSRAASPALRQSAREGSPSPVSMRSDPNEEAPHFWFPSPPPQVESEQPVDQPMAVTKFVDAVVAQEVEGLGECLAICSQRSRTLKLLGFQHLHYDARLQAFLEMRARSLGVMVMDLLIMARALFGMREVVRLRFLWQRTARCQRQLGSDTKAFKGLKEKQDARKDIARHVLETGMNKTAHVKLLKPFSNWMRAHFLCRVEEMAKDNHEMRELLHKKLQAKVRQKCESLMYKGTRLVFDAILHNMFQCRDKRRMKLRLMRQTGTNCEGIANEVFHSWKGAAHKQKMDADANNEVRRSKKKTKDKMQDVFRTSFRIGRSQGVDWLYVFEAWSKVVEADKSIRRAQEQRMKTVGAKMKHHMAGAMALGFTGWVAGMEILQWEKNNKEQHQRQKASIMANLSRREKDGHSGLLMSVMSGWNQYVDVHKKGGRAKDRSKAAATRSIMANDDSLKNLIVTSWNQAVMVARQERSSDLAKTLQITQGELISHRLEERKRLMHCFMRLVSNNNVGHMRTYFMAWNFAKVRELEQKLNKSGGKQGLMKKVAASSDECIMPCFLQWCIATAEWKAIRQVQEVQYKYDDAMAIIKANGLEGEDRKHEQKEQTMNLMRKLLAGSQKAVMQVCADAWLKFAETEKFRKIGKTSTLKSASKMLSNMDSQFKKTVFAEWIMAHRMGAQQRQIDELNSKMHQMEESAGANGSRQKQAALGFAQGKADLGEKALKKISFEGWHEIKNHAAEQKAIKQQHSKVAGHMIAQNAQGLLFGIFAAWMRDAAHSKQERIKLELEGYASACRQQMEENVLSSADSAKDQHNKKIAAVAKQLEHAMRGGLQTAVSSWHQLVEKEKQFKEVKKKNMAAMHRKAMGMDGELEGAVFNAWQRQWMVDKQESFREKMKKEQEEKGSQSKHQRFASREAFSKNQEQSQVQTKTMVLRTWRSLADTGQLNKKKKTQAEHIAARMISGAGGALLTMIVGDWHAVVTEEHTAKATKEREAAEREKILRNSRSGSEQLFNRNWRVMYARIITAWRLSSMMDSQQKFGMGLLHGAQGKDRNYILHLQMKIAQTKFLYSWLRCIALKPFEVNGGPGNKKSPDFMKDPPALYVRPIIRSIHGQNEMVVQWDGSDNQKPAILRDTQLDPTTPEGPTRPQSAGPARRPEATSCQTTRYQVNTSAASPGGGSLTIAPVTVAPTAMIGANVSTASSKGLAPGERFVLANQAMTSDTHYRSLLEHNKREIRESGGLTGNLAGARGANTASNVSVQAWDLGPDGSAPRVTGWGLWMN